MAKVHIAEVVRHDGPGISIPASISYKDAIRILQRKEEQDETVTNFTANIDVFPFDGAYALHKALDRKFGFSIQKEKSGGFFSPPRRDVLNITIDADGTMVQIPWGILEVPGVEGYFESSYTWTEEGRVTFKIGANIKGKYRNVFDEIVKLTKEILANESIYRGKSLDIKFTDKDGETHPVPPVKFVRVDKAVRPIFSADLEDTLEHDILAYIRFPDAIRAQRGTIRRGVLLAGPYGTGKTLAATYIAKSANANGFTFIYCKAKEITQAYDFAMGYQPAVIFAEDIESVAVDRRNDQVNQLLNKLDGVDSKQQEIIVIFTTNHIEKINPAMMRPGRIDVAMIVRPPDAVAALSIARMYANDQLAEDDYSAAGEILAGLIPAVISEVVARAQIRALARTAGESTEITAVDLKGAAQSVRNEKEAFESKDRDNTTLATLVGKTALEAVRDQGDHFVGGHSENGASEYALVR